MADTITKGELLRVLEAGGIDDHVPVYVQVMSESVPEGLRNVEVNAIAGIDTAIILSAIPPRPTDDK